MRVLAIVHQRDAGPGVFADAVRARGELVEWHLAEGEEAPADPAAHDAVIVFGGAMHADQDGEHPWLAAERELLARLLQRETPLLAVCLGSQLLAQAAGGLARRAPTPEIGWHGVEVLPAGADDPLLGPLAPRFEAFQWHSYGVEVPDQLPVLARSAICTQAFRAGTRAWGIQFHAEVSAADASAWTDGYRSDPDAVAIGLDPAALREQTAARIERWNRLGRELCGRFLDVLSA